MDNLWLKLLEEYISIHPDENAVRVLFRFICRHIPLDRMLYMRINRKDKKIDVFIDYSKNEEYENSYIINVSSFLSQERINELIVDNENSINIIFDTKNNPDLWQHIQTYKRIYRSSMNMWINNSHNKDYSYSLLITADLPNQFNQKHVQIFGMLKPIICLVLDKYIKNSPDTTLYLTVDKAIPQSSLPLLQQCPDLADIMKKLEVLAKSDVTVLLEGETGTGKELFADAIHMLSARATMSFVKVNCGAIPDSLIESSFFGFEKGSFTGAESSNKGYFEQAHRGTIFLDEVGELSLSAQSRLLRVLETREIQKIGSAHATTLDFRVIAATNRDLQAMVAKGTFRKDLYYRLNIYPLKIPPLRNRHRDLQILINHFFNLYVNKMEVSPPPFIGSKEGQALKNYSWPGNIRQLKACIERAMINAKIATQEFGYSQHLYFPDIVQASSVQPRARRNTPDAEMAEKIITALEASSWKIFGRGGAAEKLGINASTLRSRMRRLNIPFGQRRKKTEDDIKDRTQHS